MSRKERRTWRESVLCQFRLTPRITGPMWFYMLLAGLALLLTVHDPIWKAAGAVAALSGVPSMVQNTRREHGAPLPALGWWGPFQNFLLAADGVFLAVCGALRGWKNEMFALGLMMAVIFGGLFLFTMVLSGEEKQETGAEPGVEKKRSDGQKGPVNFWLLGILLLTVFLISGGIWLTMGSYEDQIEREHQEASALIVSGQLSMEDMERIQEIEEKYWSFYSSGRYSFARLQTSAGGMAAVSGIGLFLWLLTLMGKGIRRLAERIS